MQPTPSNKSGCLLHKTVDNTKLQDSEIPMDDTYNYNIALIVTFLSKGKLYDNLLSNSSKLSVEFT